jgi:hypothetical protein
LLFDKLFSTFTDLTGILFVEANFYEGKGKASINNKGKKRKVSVIVTSPSVNSVIEPITRNYIREPCCNCGEDVGSMSSDSVVVRCLQSKLTICQDCCTGMKLSDDTSDEWDKFLRLQSSQTNSKHWLGYPYPGISSYAIESKHELWRLCTGCCSEFSIVLPIQISDCSSSPQKRNKSDISNSDDLCLISNSDDLCQIDIA